MEEVTNGPTRFSHWPRWSARLLLALLLLSWVYGLAASHAPLGDEPGAGPGQSDQALYQAIAERVEKGENYYAAAVGEQRSRAYPLRPFVTVRLPTLAELIGLVGQQGATLLLRLLALAAAAAWIVRLRDLTASKLIWSAAAFLIAASTTLMTISVMTWWHESWSALLIALSLACRSRERWGASLALGLAAALFREHALIYLCVMAALAVRDSRRGEAAGWLACIGIFFAALAAHAAAVGAFVTATDPVSPGWSAAGGWPFVLSLLGRCTLFGLLPAPLIAIAVPLALLGWAGRRDAASLRAGCYLAFCLAAFMLIGRPNNFYWGLMVAPLLPAGLAFAPPAGRDLLRSSRLLPGGHHP